MPSPRARPFHIKPLAAEACPERVRIDEVGEGRLTVDLDHGEELPVALLELRITTDVDELELEAELSLCLTQHFERALAEVAVRRVVERDFAYG
jgi:hypothetical protein